MPDPETALTDHLKKEARRSSLSISVAVGEGMIANEECRRVALDWMILLQELPDDADVRARFRQWRQVPACDAAWRDLNRGDDLIRQARHAHPAPSAYAPRRWKRVLPVAMAAGIATVFVGQVALPAGQADLATETGEVRSVRLADGSRVTLAPHSAIAFDGARQARLLRGTGFFAVQHDAARPFRVVASEAVATDLGTAFEVRRDDDGARIAVREGRVLASCQHRSIDPADMRAGDVAELDCATGHVRTSSARPSAMASWMQGEVVVADRPLGEAVAALRPWHRGLLLTRGPGMARHVTGVYDLRRPDRALAAMRRAHGVSVWQVTPWITVVAAD